MVQVINRGPSFGGNLGTAFGTGLGSGLQALAQHKMNEIKRQKIEDFFATQGYSPEQAKAASYAPERLQAQSLKNSQSKQANQEQSVANKKFNQDIKKEYSTYNEMEKSLDELEKLLKSGAVNATHLDYLKSKAYPKALSGPAGKFENLASHVVNLASSGLTGIRSKYLTELLEKEKPSLRYDVNTNLDVIKRYKEKIKEDKETLKKDYNFLGKEKYNPASFQVGQKLPQLPDPKTYPQDKGIRTKDGRVFRSNGTDWVEVGGE